MICPHSLLFFYKFSMLVYYLLQCGKCRPQRVVRKVRFVEPIFSELPDFLQLKLAYIITGRSLELLSLRSQLQTKKKNNNNAMK